MAVQTVKDLFLDELRDIYHAEKQAIKAYPKMVKAISSDELKKALAQHLEETRAQVERLDQVFEMLDVPKRGKRCEAMEGLIEEGRSLMDEVEDASVRDVGLIGHAQKMEHYEIASYGTAVTLAKALGHADAARLLGETLEEEKRTDQRLTEIAEGSVNPEAMGQAGGAEAEAEDGDEDGDEEGAAAAPKAAAAAKKGGAKAKGTRAR